MIYGSYPLTATKNKERELPSREYNAGQWTKARYTSFITSILRSGSRRWPPKYTALNKAKTEKKINVSSGRMAQHFKCAKCLEDFPAKEVQVDHIKPMGFDRTWDDFINELYCEAKNLQILCKACHKVKTAAEKPKKKTK